jgi:hypothetical protein
MYREPKPAGNLLRDWLSARGITEERASRLARRFRLSGCFCGEIRRWLNRQYWLFKILSWLKFPVAYYDQDIY